MTFVDMMARYWELAATSILASPLVGSGAAIDKS